MFGWLFGRNDEPADDVCTDPDCDCQDAAEDYVCTDPDCDCGGDGIDTDLTYPEQFDHHYDENDNYMGPDYDYYWDGPNGDWNRRVHGIY